MEPKASPCPSVFSLESLEPRLLLSGTVLVDWGGDYSGTPSLDAYTAYAGDFDGDGLADDQAAGRLFSDSVAFREGQPSHLGTSSRFYGGVVGIAHDGTATENFDNYRVEGDGLVNIRFQTSEGTARSYHSLFYWKKEDFLNDPGQPITFDSDTYLRLNVVYPGGTGRWVVRDGSDFYVSQGTFGSGVNWLTGDDLMNMSWAAYAPTSDVAGLDFDQTGPFNVATADFTDITAVGILNDADTWGSTRLWERWTEFTVDLDSYTALADMTPSVTVASGDVDPNSGVHARQWWDGSQFMTQSGQAYSEGVGFYYGDGFYPGLSATYDLTELPEANRVLRFDLFADAGAGDFPAISGERMHVRIVSGGSVLFESNVTLGADDAPLHDDIYVDFGTRTSFTIQLDTDTFVSPGLHGGVVFGDAEFVTSNPNELAGAGRGLVASAIGGDGNRTGLFWYDDVSGEDGFEIHRSADGGQTWALHDVSGTNGGVVNWETWQDTSAVAGNTYWYRVRGYVDTDNDEVPDGWSQFTPVVSATASSLPSPAVLTPIVEEFGSDGEQRNGVYVDSWYDGSSFQRPDGTSASGGLGFYGGIAYTNPDSYCTFFAPSVDSGKQVLTFDAFLDPSRGDFTQATARNLRLKVFGSFVRGADGRFGTSPELLYEGNLSYGAGDAAVLEDVYVDLAGHETFTIAVYEDHYDGSHPHFGLVLADTSFAASVPSGPATPMSVTASAVSGDDSKIVLSWTDMSTTEDYFRIERSLDHDVWTEIGTHSSATTGDTGDRIFFIDDVPTAGMPYFYRVRAHQTFGDPPTDLNSSYSAVAKAIPSASRSLADLGPIAIDIPHTVNPAAGAYEDSWFDGSALQASDGTVFSDGVGVLFSLAPFSGIDLTYYVPEGEDIFRMDLFSDPAFNSGNRPEVEIYGDYGTSNQTLLAFYTAATSDVIEDIYLGVDGYTSLTFAFGADQWGWTSSYRNMVMANAGFVDSYPPGPLPPSFLKAGAAPVERIELRWQDNSTDEDGFLVERAYLDPDDGLQPWEQIAELASDTAYYNDTGLQVDSTYYYRVRAYNGEGQSPWSNIAINTTNARTDDFDVLTSTYVGGDGEDAGMAVDIQDDGTIVWAGILDEGFAPGGLVATELLGGGDSAVVRYDQTGTQLLSLTRLPGTAGFYYQDGDKTSYAAPDGIWDMELAASGDIALAVRNTGLVVLSSDASSVLWSAGNPTYGAGEDAASYSIKRVAAGDGVVAAIYSNPSAGYDHYVLVFENDHDDTDGVLDGELIAERHLGDTALEDVAIHASSQLVYVCGYNNKFTSAEPAQVNFVRAFDYTGDMSSYEWKLYDWPGSTLRPGVQAPNVADSRGYRISIGRDGNLYYLGESAGGNSTFLFDPQDASVRLDGSVFYQSDAYNSAYNTASNHITFIGRYDAYTGAIDKATWLIARLSGGAGNTIRSRGITADEDGNVYVAGVSAYAIENRNGKMVEGQATGSYSGDGFLLQLHSSFAFRTIWTSLAESGNSGWSIKRPGGYGIATRNGLTAAAISLDSEDGRVITTANAAQPERGSSDESYLVTWGGWADQMYAPQLQASQSGANTASLEWVDNASLKNYFLVERKEEGGAFQEIGQLGKTVFAFEDIDLTTGTTYTYRVRAHRLSGDVYSPYSNEVSVTVQQYQPGDLDRSGSVSFLEAATVVARIGRTPATWEDGDSDGDSVVTVIDADAAVASYLSETIPPRAPSSSTVLTAWQEQPMAEEDLHVEMIDAAGAAGDQQVSTASEPLGFLTHRPEIAPGLSGSGRHAQPAGRQQGNRHAIGAPDGAAFRPDATSEDLVNVLDLLALEVPLG